MADHHFISYSGQDGQDFAHQLYEELFSGDPPIFTWLDKASDGLRPGIDYQVQIDEAIQSCKTLLFVMTADSVDPKSACTVEWNRALQLKKPVIPLQVHEPDRARMPLWLGLRQYIDFSGEFKPALAKLREHLLWLDTTEGKLHAVRDRLGDANRARRRAAGKDEEEGRVLAEIEELKKEAALLSAQGESAADSKARVEQRRRWTSKIWSAFAGRGHRLVFLILALTFVVSTLFGYRAGIGERTTAARAYLMKRMEVALDGSLAFRCDGRVVALFDTDTDRVTLLEDGSADITTRQTGAAEFERLTRVTALMAAGVTVVGVISAVRSPAQTTQHPERTALATIAALASGYQLGKWASSRPSCQSEEVRDLALDAREWVQMKRTVYLWGLVAYSQPSRPATEYGSRPAKSLNPNRQDFQRLAMGLNLEPR